MICALFTLSYRHNYANTMQATTIIQRERRARERERERETERETETETETET